MTTSESIQPQSDTSDTSAFSTHSAVYNLFIILLTIFSLAIMAFQLLPILTDATRQVLYYVDTLICFIFLYDFFDTLRRSSPKSDYFFKRAGWLDLLGSIPAIPALRLARLARLTRIIRFMRNKSSAAAMWADFKEHRAQSAILLILLTAIITITICATLVLQVEHRNPDANIVTGEDAFWWAYVTVTTVGYGDRYPTTTIGRILGMILMTVGIAIFGSLSGFLSHLFLTGNSEQEEIEQEDLEAAVANLRSDISVLRNEISQTQDQLHKMTVILQESYAKSKRHKEEAPRSPSRGEDNH